ncbi:MAG: DUF3382 domain-containing protein, partial [Xanthobacteraceae bacterium]|nr:DUF3382 domain-containing protein [Xanthobacteraceae bacterium]
MPAETTNSASGPDLVRAFRAAAFTGLIAAGLFLPLIAFRASHDIRNELILETRWPLFAAFVAAAFVGQLTWELLPRERLWQDLSAFFRSPKKLAAAAGICGFATAVLRLAGTAGFGGDAELALALSVLLAVCTIAFVIGAGVAGVTTRYPATTDT